MTKPIPDNTISFVELPATNESQLTSAKAFYSSVFGWSYQDWGDDYADTKDSGVGTGINADPAHRPSQPLAVVYTTDLQVARERVVAANGKIVRDIFAFPGGRRFHFKDPIGNELAVWSDR